VPVARRYRPRHPRASPIWQVFDRHWSDYQASHPERARAVAPTVRAFQRCGDFHAGFTRWRCEDCAHEFLHAFTCKQRMICASCAQRRTLTLAPVIAEEICQAVPHRHVVLTIPRLLRPLFQRKRALLGELFHAANAALSTWLGQRTQTPDGQPGLVIAAQTFGDFLTWHPHLHVLVTGGVWRRDHSFALAPAGGWADLTEIWRQEVLSRLLKAGAIGPDLVAKLLSWRHSGFTLDAGESPLAAADTAGRQRLAEYLIRCPFSLEKITYEPRTGTVLYRSAKHWRTRRNFEVFSGTAFIDALLTHLPPKNVPMLRYYGAYSNRARGAKRAAATQPASSPATAPASTRRRRRPWRQLILQVWGADPLQCPLCHGQMKLLEVLESRSDISATLEPLGLWTPAQDDHHSPPTAGPPALQIHSLESGEMIHLTATPNSVAPLGPRAPVTVHPGRLPSDPLAWRCYLLGEASSDPEVDFDACGCEFPAGFQPFPDESDQTELWDEGYQSFADESEPVFWTQPTDSGLLPSETKNFLQASIDGEFIQRFPEE